jgi:uncharacterized protein
MTAMRDEPSQEGLIAHPTTPRARIVDLDVVRAVALIGVVVLNFHGYLILYGGKVGTSFVNRVFDPSRGPLSTRFAATFVTVAGMGISLLTARSRAATGDEGRRARSDDRWKLLRRGLLLYAFGYVFDWIWPGTILFFYGAFFVAGALLFHLRVRWIALVGTLAALSAAGLQWWMYDRQVHGHRTTWITSPGARSPRGLLLDTFVNGTHPLLPWLAYLCLGIVIGRQLPLDRTRRLRMIAVGVALVIVGYGVRTAFDSTAWQRKVFATTPFDRGLMYVVSTIGSTLVAFAVVGWLAERFAHAPLTRSLAIAGRTTLTIYVAHALVFDAFVTRWGLVRPTGLDTALLFAGAFWVLAVLAAVAWYRMFGMGPLERIYRRFGGGPPQPFPVLGAPPTAR